MGLIAERLVEHCTGIAEVSVQVPFRPFSLATAYVTFKPARVIYTERHILSDFSSSGD